MILRTFDISYVRVESEIEDDTEAKCEISADNIRENLSQSVGEVDARGEGVAVESDPTACVPSSISVSVSVSPPITEAEGSVLRSCESKPILESTPEVGVVAKRVRPSRWDTVKTPVGPDTSAAQVMLSTPPPPPPIFHPPTPAHSTVRPPSLLSAATAAPAPLSEQCNARPTDGGSSAPTSSAKALEEDLTSDHPGAADAELAEPEVEVVVLNGVRSDHIRLLCDGDGNVLGAQGDIVSTALERSGEAPPVEVVASTGKSHSLLCSYRAVSVSVFANLLRIIQAVING